MTVCHVYLPTTLFKFNRDIISPNDGFIAERFSAVSGISKTASFLTGMITDSQISWFKTKSLLEVKLYYIKLIRAILPYN